jgi:CHAD domain-containing protein
MAVTTPPAAKNRRLSARRVPLLRMRTPVAMRRIARAYLAAARRARRRLHVESDVEALHDFRVALRRLRSTLRLYRPVVDARMVPRKWRRRLKRLARTTSAARDAEVGLAWLRSRREDMSDAERAACDRLILDWTARCDKAYAKVRRTLDKEFEPLDAGLRQVLGHASNQATAPALAPTAGALLYEQITELGSALRRIASATDAQAIHAARVEAKRLRYLLEPIGKELANGERLLKTLKKFQDDSGELCDRYVLSEELIAVAARDAAERSVHAMRRIFDDTAAGPLADLAAMAGVSALAGRLNTERRQLYADFEKRYLGDHTDPLLAPYRALADTLANAQRKPAQRRSAVAAKRATR